MQILELVAENFKKLRVVEIRPQGNAGVVKITGKNGQGKSSVLDAIWFALKGRKALPMKPVRKGAERMKVRLDLGEFTITRTLGSGSDIPTLAIEMKQGKKRDKTPEAFLDDILGELTFDPLEFIRMDTKAQIAVLRQTAKVAIDFEAIAAANADDYEARKAVNAEVRRLEAQLQAHPPVLEGLPKEKVDEQAILERLNAAGERNKEARKVYEAKQELGAAAARIGLEKVQLRSKAEKLETEIADLEKTVRAKREEHGRILSDLGKLDTRHKQAEAEFQNAPAGEEIDVAALTEQLTAAQRTNRAIANRESYGILQAALEAKRRASEAFTRAIEQRDEQKREALTNAKMPIDGLVFDETQVLFKGIPIDQLGEGEQIRISASIGMAINPKLRVLCIRHGEALDEDGMKILEELARDNDFQIWMARVDSSGKVGIVMEDGMIAARNEGD